MILILVRSSYRCLLSIAEISVESLHNDAFRIALVVNNTGLVACTIRVLLEEHSRKQSDLTDGVLVGPMHRQLIFFTLTRESTRRTHSVPVMMTATVNDLRTNSTLAKRDFIFQHGQHCTCVSICRCQVRSSYGSRSHLFGTLVLREHIPSRSIALAMRTHDSRRDQSGRSSSGLIVHIQRESSIANSQ
jgi:hypothetical protein